MRSLSFEMEYLPPYYRNIAEIIICKAAEIVNQQAN